MKQLYSNRRKEDYHTKIRAINKRRILEVIIHSGNYGISKSQISLEARIDRKNLTKYLKELTDDNLLRKGPGKQGKYFAETGVFHIVNLNGKFFGELFAEKMLLKKYHLHRSSVTEILRKKGFVDFTHVPHLSPGLDSDTLQLLQTLFELSNTVGGFILFILIQAMNPSNKTLRVKGKSEDEIIESWTAEAISNIVPMLLPMFKTMIETHILKYLVTKDDPYGGLIDYSWKEPFYQLPGKVIEELKTVFKVLYPLLYEDLDNIYQNIPKHIEAEKLYWEYQHNAKKRQATCTHTIVKVHDYDLYGERMKNRYVEHCQICHKTWN
jgi:hypothetical protein